MPSADGDAQEWHRGTIDRELFAFRGPCGSRVCHRHLAERRDSRDSGMAACGAPLDRRAGDGSTATFPSVMTALRTEVSLGACLERLCLKNFVGSGKVSTGP